MQQLLDPFDKALAQAARIDPLLYSRLLAARERVAQTAVAVETRPRRRFRGPDS